MKILFLYPIPAPRFQIVGIQQGLASLSAVLKKAGHSCSLFPYFHLQKEELEATLQRTQPDLVAIYTVYNQWLLVRETVGFLREKVKSLPIILGSVFPTLMPQEAITLEGILGICQGEGEMPLLELASLMEEGKDFFSIANCWFRGKGGEIIRNPIRPYLHDLDSLPFPDRSLFEGHQLCNCVDFLEFTASRGCPQHCSNCFHHSWKRAYGTEEGYSRFKSVGYIIKEIKEALKEKPSMKKIGFHDASLTTFKEWLLEFCEAYKREVGVPFWCNTRADTLDEEVVRALKEASCYELHIGVESGSEFTRNEVLKKEIKREDLLRGFALAREAGIQTFAFNMVGLPYDTPERIEEGIELNRLLKPDTLFVSVFFPYPGTDLYDLCQKEGWLSQRHVESYFDHSSVLNQPSISVDQIKHYHRVFKHLVYHPRLKWPILLWEKLVLFMEGTKISKDLTLLDAARKTKGFLEEKKRELDQRT